MRDLPAVGWLVAAGVVVLTHSVVPEPRWLLVHLVLLGAATHSILVWSRYFTDAVLHTAPDDGDRVRQERRLVLLNAGALLVVVGVYVGLVGADAPGRGRRSCPPSPGTGPSSSACCAGRSRPGSASRSATTSPRRRSCAAGWCSGSSWPVWTTPTRGTSA